MSSVPTKESVSQDNCTISADQLSFNFGNLCGAPYSGGSVVFSSEGTCLYSPVSNRVLVTDLSSNRSSTARPEMRSATDLIVTMPVNTSKFGKLVLSIDVDGYGILFEAISGVVLNRINFKGKVRAAAFSHDGAFLATGTGRRIKVWRSACVENNWQFVMYRQFAGHIGDVRSLQWAPPVAGQVDLLLSAGADSIVRVWSLNFEDSPHSILNDLTQSIVGAYFFDGRNGVVAVNSAGTIQVWKRSDKNSTDFVADSKAAIQQGVGYVTCSSFDAFSGLLCLGLSGGAFALYEIPSMSAVQSFSVGSAVTSVSVSAGGDWIAVGVEDAGQLIVWEWRAENFILKQQGHHDGVNCVAFCPVGSMSSNTMSSDLLDVFGGSASATFNAGGGLIATGGVEGKMKLWHSLTGFCFVTLSDHTSSIEAISFFPQGNAVVSASMDGSVRAYDLLRYKNFRTFTAPDARVQFGSLAIDPSGELIAAGSANGNYNIYLWATKTGQCVDILPGHEARISHLRFAPSSNDGILASTSWDSSLKIWNVFANKNKGGVPESLLNQREVTCCAFDPIDGTVAAVATLSGHITFWDTRNGVEVGSIDGIRDIGSGRKDGEKFASGALGGKKSKRDGSGLQVNLNQYFSAIQYGGAAGRWLAAVSKGSVFVCIYDPLEKSLVSRIELTCHAGLSGVKQFLNSKFDNDMVVNDDYDDVDRVGKRARGRAAAIALPGVARGDMKTGTSKKVWRVNGIAVSPDGQELAVATSEGAYVLTLHGTAAGAGGLPVAIQAFTPSSLTEDVSKAAVDAAIATGDLKTALITALSLNDSDSFKQVFNACALPETIAGCVSSVPRSLFLPLLQHLGSLIHPIDGTARIERAMLWVTLLIQLQFAAVQQVVHQTSQGRQLRAVLCSILQHVQTQASALGSLLRDNAFALGFLAPRPMEDEEEDEVNGDGPDRPVEEVVVSM